jgi:hypothetical protein
MLHRSVISVMVAVSILLLSAASASAASKCLSAASVSPSTESSSASEVQGFWLGNDGALYQSKVPSGAWGQEPKSLGEGVAPGSSPEPIVDPWGAEVVYYVGTDGYVHQLYEQNGKWKSQALTLAGKAAPNTTPAVINDPWGKEVIYFVGEDHAIHQIAWYGGESWYAYPLGGAVAANTSPAVANQSGQEYIAYVGSDNAIHEWVWAGEGTWSNPSVGGDVRSNSSPSIVANPWGTTPAIYFSDVDGYAHQLANYGGTWGNYPLPFTKMGPNTSPAAVNDPWSKEDVYITDAEGGIYQIAWYGGSSWYGYPIGGNTVAPNTSPSVVNESTASEQIMYIGTDGAVHDWEWASGANWSSHIVGASAEGRSGCKTEKWYYSKSSGGCVYTGVATYTCSEVGKGYLKSHVIGGGGAGFVEMSPPAKPGDYCNYYRPGSSVTPWWKSLLTTADSESLSAYTGFSPPTPLGEYQETDGTGLDSSPPSACQAYHNTYGLWLNGHDSAPGCPEYGKCASGMQHTVAFGESFADVKPWSSTFGSGASLEITNEMSGVAREDSAPQTGGYACVDLVDTESTARPALEDCLVEWTIAAGEGGGDTPVSCGVLPNGQDFASFFSGTAPGTRHWTIAPGSHLQVTGGASGTYAFAGEITPQNLESMVQDANSTCGFGYAANPGAYALLGIENGFEGQADLGHFGGFVSNLNAFTNYRS